MSSRQLNKPLENSTDRTRSVNPTIPYHNRYFSIEPKTKLRTQVILNRTQNGAVD